MLGEETPCYTIPSTALVPATTTTMSGVAVITGHLFTRKYDLAPPRSGLSTGATTGIAVGVALAAIAALCAFALFFLRRRRAKKRQLKAEAAAATTMSEEKGVASPVSGAQELPSPQSHPNSPRSIVPVWSASQGYVFPFQGASRLPSPKPPSAAPQELPGSTFIHEHHPAFGPTGPTGPTGEERIPSPRTSPKPTSPTLSVTSPGSVISPMEGER